MAFVGRERELARLAATLEGASRGELRRAVILGPAGAGSTRLLSELAARLADVPEVVVARGAALPPLEGVPYAPLATALESVLAPLDDARLRSVAGPAATDLAELVPALAPRLGDLPARTWSPPDQRATRLALTTLDLLERLAGSGLVVLVLEDLHWADPATRRFVEVLLTLERRAPICLVLSYRPEELHLRHPMRDLAARMRATPGIEWLELAPLERHELMQLAQGHLGERPGAALLAALSEGSRGSPLLAEQLLAVHQAADGIRLSDPFDEIVWARLSLLSPGALQCLRVLAAARRPLPRELLTRLELPGGRLRPRALEEALRSGMALEDAGVEPHVGLIHDRYAEAIETLGLPVERQPLHEALARALPGRPAEQAWHWEAAMRFGAARNAHVEAGESSARLDPGGTTLFHDQRALELLEAHETGAAPLGITTAELLVRAAEAAAAAENPRRAVALVQQAIDEWNAARARTPEGRAGRDGGAQRGDGAAQGPRDLGDLYLRLARFRGAAGDQAGALEAVRTAVETIPPEAGPTRARALAELAQRLMLDGDFTASERVAREARDVATAVGTAALAELGHATCTLGVDLGYTGRLQEGLAALEEASQVARSTRRVDDLVRAAVNRNHLLQRVASRPEDALPVARQALEEVERLGAAATYGPLLRSSIADILSQMGRWREAEAECRAALAASPTRTAWSALLTLGGLLVESRADEEAGRVVGSILLQLEAVREAQRLAYVHRLEVSYALWRRDVDDALRVARQGWERLADEADWPQVAFAAATTLEAAAAAAEQGRIRHDMGSVAAATELAASVVAVLREHAMPARTAPGTSPETRLWYDTALAHAARVQGHARAEAWARIADGWWAVGERYLAAKARWWEAAAALRQREQRPRGREALREAWELALELPARPLLGALAELARMARVRLPGQEEPAVVALLRDGGDERAPVAVGPGSSEQGSRGAVSVMADPRSTAPSAAGAPANGSVGDRFAGRLLPAPAATVVRDPFNLSPREYEVLAIIAEGRTNREIAERLFISERTVGVHVRNILGKLGVAGRVEAASVAIRLGLVAGLPAPSGR